MARIGDPIHTRESEDVVGRIRDRIHICSSISEFKVTKRPEFVSCFFNEIIHSSNV